MKVFTIGYEGLDIDAFLSLLAEHDIETVVDVRELPLSRKPGFSKKALCNNLTLSDLHYIHMPNLGCPKPVRNRFREDGDWQRYTVGFLNHLKEQTAAIAELSAKVLESKCALLCFEADFNFCHRTMVANAVSDLCGSKVEHIQNKKTRKTTAASALPAFS